MFQWATLTRSEIRKLEINPHIPIPIGYYYDFGKIYPRRDLGFDGEHVPSRFDNLRHDNDFVCVLKDFFNFLGRMGFWLVFAAMESTTTSLWTWYFV